ncbi:MAG: hypothetical protein CME19_16305 [Gemmatimonadetes bacterium]|nr:hypothetical protein [Gemmatimonadota bacterium]
MCGLLCSVLLLAGSAVSQEYAGDPLSIGAGARALGMGSAFVGVSDGATSLYWNPAGLTRLGRNEIQAQHAEQFGGTINHDIIVVGIPSNAGTFSVGLVRVGVDGIQLSALEDLGRSIGADNRPTVSGNTGTSDYSLDVGYGRAINEKLSLGSRVKVIWRKLSVGNGTGYGIDLGLQYIARDSLRVGLVIRDARSTRISFDSGKSDTISPSLDLGMGWTRPVGPIDGHLLLAASLLLNAETSSADDGQHLRVGAEYRHRTGLSARLGIEGDHLTAGAGLSPTDRIRVDVAFLENDDLDNTYRISASLYF